MGEARSHARHVFNRVGFAPSAFSVLCCWMPTVNYILWALMVAILAIGLGRRPHGFTTARLLMVFMAYVLMRVIAYGQVRMPHWARGSY